MGLTLKELAHTLDLSASTVSRALSGQPGIAPKTVERVKALAQELGYTPDSRARALRTGQGEGLVVISLFTAPTIYAMRTQALLVEGQNYFGRVQVVTLESPAALDLAVCRVLGQNPQAIVINAVNGDLSNSTRRELRQRGVPIVAIDTGIPECDSVRIDRQLGTYQAARLLLLSGCKHPVFFSNTPLDSPDARLRGIIAAFQSLGRDTRDIRLAACQASSLRGGYEAMRHLMTTSAVDGAFCYNDEMTLGALRALAETGLRVPDDVRLIGFDNLPFTEFCLPSLTTVAQPVEEAAQAAVDCCRARLENPEAPMGTRRFAARLLVRESAPLETQALREAVFHLPESLLSD